jgi:hypothetical protein
MKWFFKKNQMKWPAVRAHPAMLALNMILYTKKLKNCPFYRFLSHNQ